MMKALSVLFYFLIVHVALAGHQRGLSPAEMDHLHRDIVALDCMSNDLKAHYHGNDKKLKKALHQFEMRVNHLHKAVDHGFSTIKKRTTYAHRAAVGVAKHRNKLPDRLRNLFERAHELTHHIEDLVRHH